MGGGSDRTGQGPKQPPALPPLPLPGSLSNGLTPPHLRCPRTRPSASRDDYKPKCLKDPKESAPKPKPKPPGAAARRTFDSDDDDDEDEMAAHAAQIKPQPSQMLLGNKPRAKPSRLGGLGLGMSGGGGLGGGGALDFMGNLGRKKPPRRTFGGDDDDFGDGDLGAMIGGSISGGGGGGGGRRKAANDEFDF